MRLAVFGESKAALRAIAGAARPSLTRPIEINSLIWLAIWRGLTIRKRVWTQHQLANSHIRLPLTTPIRFGQPQKITTGAANSKQAPEINGEASIRNPFRSRRLERIEAALKSQSTQLSEIYRLSVDHKAQGIKLMAQSDDLAAAVSALASSATAAEAAISAEPAIIAANSGANPAIATAITNIQAITAGLTSAAASVPAPAPSPAPAAPAA